MASSKLTNLNTTKKDLVLDLVREAILSGEYSPGEKILQDRLAEELNVSQTPVREALRVLEAEGIIYHSPHKGVRVSEATIDDIREIYEIRRELEPLAIRHAIPNIPEEDLIELRALYSRMDGLAKTADLEGIRLLDYRFHMLIYESAHMPELLRIIRIMWTKLPSDIYQMIPGNATKSIEEHREILRAIEDRNVTEGERKLRKHMDRVSGALTDYIEERKRIDNYQDCR